MDAQFENYSISKITNKRFHKEIFLKKSSIDSSDGSQNIDDVRTGKVEDKNTNPNQTLQKDVHRLALLGKADTVVISDKDENTLFASNDQSAKLIPISPLFRLKEKIDFANKKYTILFKELENEEDFLAYKNLSQFHYRTIAEEKKYRNSKSYIHAVGGRNAVILCRIKFGNQDIPVGYIQLQQPLMMCKPRHVLFNTPFSHPSRDIKWQKWDAEARKTYTNLIVRIGRVVTDPEFRGMGISRYLIKAAKQFSTERWHLRGISPLFIEISAEMLRYIDFVSSSGFRYIGNTEGNLKRITSDLQHIEKVMENRKITGGVLSMQKKYLVSFQKKCSELDRDWKKEIRTVEKICKNPELLFTIPPHEMALYRSVIRLPIPYYLSGLDNVTNDYIDHALANISTDGLNTKIIKRNLPNPSVELDNFSIGCEYLVEQTKHERKMMSAFGLPAKSPLEKIVKALTFASKAESINFIWGPSGAGKSVLLQSLDIPTRNPSFNYQGELMTNQDAKIGWLSEITSNLSIIDYFSNQWGIEKSISAMNSAGLSEASLYLKSYNMLSAGQKYRACIAQLMLQQKTVWLIDEFCADLDPITAKVIAMNIRKHVKKNKLIAFIAAANYQHFLDALNPLSVIVLKQGYEPRVMIFKEFKNEFYG